MKRSLSDAAMLNASLKLQLAAWSLLQETAGLHEDIRKCVRLKAEARRETKRAKRKAA